MAGQLAASSSLLVVLAEERPPPNRSIQVSSPELSHAFLIKQSSILSVDAASRLLLHTLTALQDLNRAYCLHMQELTTIYEMSAGGLPLALTSQDLYEAMLRLRLKVKTERQQLSDLRLLWEYARKLMEASAETSFLAGAEYCSVEASERLASAQRHVDQELGAAAQLEAALRHGEQAHIAQGGGRPPADGDGGGIFAETLGRLLQELKEPPSEPPLTEEEIPIVAAPDEPTSGDSSGGDEEEVTRPPFRFEGNSDDLIKITVKPDPEDEEDALSSQRSREQPNDDSMSSSSYRMPTF